MPKFVVLAAGESEPVPLDPEPPDPMVTALTAALGGRVQDGYVRLGQDLIAWARPSTIVAAGVAMALAGDAPAALGVGDLRQTLGEGSGVAVFAVGGGTDGRADKRRSGN